MVEKPTWSNLAFSHSDYHTSNLDDYNDDELDRYYRIIIIDVPGHCKRTTVRRKKCSVTFDVFV